MSAPRTLAETTPQALRLSEIAEQLLHALGRGVPLCLQEELDALDVVVIVGRRAEEAGGRCGSAAAITSSGGERQADHGTVYLALVLQGLAALIDGDRSLLAQVVEGLSAQVELDAAALETDEEGRA